MIEAACENHLHRSALNLAYQLFLFCRAHEERSKGGTAMKKIITTGLIFLFMYLISGCGINEKEKQLNDFIDNHVNQIKPISIEANLAYWNAALTGNEDDFIKYSEMELKIRQIYSNKEEYTSIKEYKDSGQIKNALLKRQLDILYNGYLENQMEPELLKKIVDLSSKVEHKFSIFRGAIWGRKVTNNEIKEILKNESNSNKRKEAWFASKQVGPVVASDIIQLVKWRNKAARELGFDNYHTLSLTVSELDVEKLNQIFDELYGLTYKPFGKLKAELDSILAEKYNIQIEELMPWHYHDPFFQETPLVYELNLDNYYKGKNIEELGRSFYKGIGLNVESILENSDLYERDNKNPHAFCTDIDREGDVRILCNLKDNVDWMETMLHELGHAVYDKYFDFNLPYLLRSNAHIFVTEAIAMFFGRLSRNASWMQAMLNLSDDQFSEINQVSDKYTRLKQLIFARWAMVMYNFEKELYADPDQNLNSLWWKIVEKYQLVNKPKRRNEPDWAAKIHFTIAPCYYHNYLMGELLASQLHKYLITKILKLNSDKNVSYVGMTKAGDYLRYKVFEAGAKYPWNEMIKKATNEYLTPKYFVEQFVN
jgi:peptidyl-dipeptidase A